MVAATGAINRWCNPRAGFKDVLRTMIDGLQGGGWWVFPMEAREYIANKMRYTDDYMPLKYKLSND